MHLVHTPAGQRFLLVWRTETLFCTPERRRLAGEWSHVRFTSQPLADEPTLINRALDAPLPFGDGTFDAIYSFHVIEHLGPVANERFIRDVFRLLKPGAVYRASTPDLELLAEDYLLRLREQAGAPSSENHARYRWALCNLIDQCVRETSGGELAACIGRGEFTREHVKLVNGDSLDFLFNGAPAQAPLPSRFATRLVDGSVTRDWRQFARKSIAALRRRIDGRLTHARQLALEHEKNLWLFDRVSLGELFRTAGFRDVTVLDHRTSAIPDWPRYNFDQSAHGEHPLEPSLYVEGRK